MKVFRNGIRHPQSLKEQAVVLRKNGQTHREIRHQLNISLGSASLWTAGVVLTQRQKEAIYERRKNHSYTPEERIQMEKRLHRFQFKVQYSNDDLTEKIRAFHREYGRIPLKREFHALKIYRDRFGSWNEAIKKAGFDANEVLFSKKHTAKDGHRCDSFSEVIIDDLLSDRAIPHKRSVRYESSKYTADFFVEPNTVIEFFGLAGVKKKYDAHIIEKRLLCKQLSLQLIELYPVDIFGKGKEYKTKLIPVVGR